MHLTSSFGPPAPTERLFFRVWTEDDLPLAVALWTHADVMRHMGGVRTAAGAADRLHNEIDTLRDHGIQYWPIFHRETGGHAGCAGLRPFHGSLDVLEVGIHLARAFWSSRMGEEAARAVIAYAWRHTQADVLVAGHGPDNAASKALIERLGFRYTHHEPWGPHAFQHPYYRLERPAAML